MKPEKDVYSSVLLQEIERLQAEIKLQELTSERLRQDIEGFRKTIAKYRMAMIGRHPYESQVER